MAIGRVDDKNILLGNSPAGSEDLVRVGVDKFHEAVSLC